MKRITLLLTALILLISIDAPVSAGDISNQKTADIEKLLEITGALAIGKQMSDVAVSQLSQAIKSSRPDIPAELFTILEQEVNGLISENIPKFIALIIPVYDQHFTHDEIKGLIRFYQTDLGKKTIREMPLLMQESMTIGQQWGNALGPEIQRRVIERFKAEGVDLTA